MGHILTKGQNIAAALLLLFTSGWALSAACEGDPASAGLSLSFHDAVLMAFKNNKDILIQENEIKAAKAELLGAKSAFLPKAVVSAGYTHTDAVLELPIPETKKDKGLFIGYEDENKAGVGVEQPIFMGGRNIARLKQAKLRMRAEEEALRSRKLSTEFEVKRLFYGLLLAFETERITKELISQAESHYNEVKNKYKEGTASRFDLLQSKVQVSKVMPQFVRAKNAEQLIASELKKLLGVNMNDDITLKGSLESSPIEVKEEEFLKTAYANRPELVMKALGMDINRQEIEVARADSMPQVIAGFNYDYRSNDVEDMFNPRHNNWNAGVKVSLSVFDGFAAKAKVDEARVRYAQAKLEKEDLSELIALEVRKACLDITQAESIIASQKDSVDEAKEALKIAEASYDSGVITNLDVLDAQVSLSQIEQNLSGAVYDHIMAKAYLDISMGKSSLTEADNEKR